jgi:hypothetical protein
LSLDNPYQAHVLLAVWGESFIDDFLKLSLPSLLAPGNLPALAENYPTRFVFLTRLRDVPVFERHPAYQRLKTICDIEFLSIEDLIVQGGYAATLTLAFDRAVRQTGEQMLKTYFVFLTSDYIMADGSLQGLMRYMQKGYSGICAGNFQVIKEEVEPFLSNHIQADTHVLQIKPRELLKHSLQHLHPVTVASFYDQTITHNYRANRFFYRHEHQVMAGRFYLLHMLCIKPETMNYRIGSSCDYSFIPEMCPSGNVAVITDSDDYLVVEIQEQKHELEFVQWGSYSLANLTYALSEWTTVRHRQNAEHSIYFHTRDVSEKEKALINNELNQFVEKIDEGLQRTAPKPHYQHPYWIGAYESLIKQQALLKGTKDYDYLDLTINTTTHAKKLYYQLFGQSPQVFRWHYRWREYRLTTDLLETFINPKNTENTAVFYGAYQSAFMKYCGWFKRALRIPHHFYLKSLLHDPDKLAQLRSEKFQCCVLMIPLNDLGKIQLYLDTLKNMLADDGRIILFIPNEGMRSTQFSFGFKKEFAYKMNALLNTPFQILRVETIHNNLSMLGTWVIETILQTFSHSRKKRFLFYTIFGIPGCTLALIRHLFPIMKNSRRGHCKNILVTLAPKWESAHD